MDKPIKKYHHPKLYDWGEVEKYISEKYNIEFPSYEDAWHWISRDGFIRRGGTSFVWFKLDPEEAGEPLYEFKKALVDEGFAVLDDNFLYTFYID